MDLLSAWVKTLGEMVRETRGVVGDVGERVRGSGTFVGVSATLKDADWGLLGSYAGLVGLAVFAIYAGAHGSLPRPKRAKVEGEAEDEEDEEDIERVSADDAWLFPIIGSVALVGLYGVVTYLGEVWINWLLGWYFTVAGVGSVWNSLVSLTRWWVGETRWKEYDLVQMSVKKGRHEVAVGLRTPSVVLMPVALVPSVVYAVCGRGAVMTDVLAVSFAQNAVGLLRLDSFRTGCILLGGLFVYDVWWVFGTGVMVRVATALDVPIKLLWGKGAGRGHTMLGLGDVVVPGTFVALALRYDATQPHGKRFFWATLAAYVAGLAATICVMHVGGRAQPALLYLSPACVAAFAGTAWAAGELRTAWRWVDGPAA